MGNEEVLVAVDPHKGHNTLVVLDPVGRRPVEEAEFANTHAGYREMMRFARRWRQRRWAVEGCHGAGRFLAQRLVANGEVVLDVPAKLAARVWLTLRICSGWTSPSMKWPCTSALGRTTMAAQGLATTCWHAYCVRRAR
jgi:hypothetical protein